MKIAYATRSQFLPAFESAIQEHSAGLRIGGVVRVELPEGGYDGRVIVTIGRTDHMFFGTDWERTDPTRFRRGSTRPPPRCGTAIARAGLRFRIRMAP